METKPTDAEFVALVLEKTKSGALKWNSASTGNLKAYDTVLPSGQLLSMEERYPYRKPTILRLALYNGGGVSWEIRTDKLEGLGPLWEACEAQQDSEVEKAMRALEELRPGCPPSEGTVSETSEFSTFRSTWATFAALCRRLFR